MTTSVIDIEKIKAADYANLVHPLFHPVDQKDPFVWVKGEGAILYEAGGKQYIDGLSGLWNVSLGHGRRDLAKAGARQMEELGYVSGYVGATNVPAVQLAEKLAELAYSSINHFFFAAGGRGSTAAGSNLASSGSVVCTPAAGTSSFAVHTMPFRM